MALCAEYERRISLRTNAELFLKEIITYAGSTEDTQQIHRSRADKMDQ